MTTPTPEQMRALALRGPGPDESNGWAADVRAALRAAADQIEAVRRYVTDGEVEDDHGQHVVYTYGLAPLLGLTADTAPQEASDD